MTYRIKMFCAAYAKSLDYDAALNEAGIKKKPENSLLEDGEVSIEIAKLLAQKAARLAIDGDKVVVELMATATEARTKGDYKAAIEAYKLVAELVGAKAKAEIGRPPGGMMARPPLNGTGQGPTFGVKQKEEEDVPVVEGVAQFNS